jgi:hypothetical protein
VLGARRLEEDQYGHKQHLHPLRYHAHFLP